jgi:hypothetical protein
MRRLSIFGWVTAAAVLLTGCGGGSTISSTGSSGGGGSTVSTLSVSSNAASIPSDGSASATITVMAKDSKNAAVSGAVVTFAASAGNVTVTQGTTDATGTATATLVSGSAAPGSTITVTASSGGASGTASVTVANTQKTLTLLTSLPQIPSDGTKAATISALVRDSNNNFVSGTAVSFQASSGGLTITKPTTDATGTATATLSAAGDTTNRTITVTAQAGTATATIKVNVVGTKLTVNGPSNLVQGSLGTYTVSLTDSGGVGIPNQAVTLTSSAVNTLTPATYMTDATGQKTFTLTAVNSGNDTITAAAEGLQATQAVAVSDQSFSITAPAPNATVILGVSAPVTVSWLVAGAPQVGKTVAFSATRGTLSAASAVTDASGNASVSISSTGAGPSIINASGTGVTSQINIAFVANNPSQVAVQAGPASVPVSGQSTITALVRDAANNLVQGATVDFKVVADPTNGGLSVASATTDAQGVARTVYTAGGSSSGANAVTVSATVHATVITGTASLTVGGQTVFLSLGTGNTIDTGQGVAVYQITYSVFAVDSQGAALPNIPVTLSVLPLAYGKGVMGHCPGTNWSPVYSTATTDPNSYGNSNMCKNEDSDYTGNIASLDSGAATTCTNLTLPQPSTPIPSHAKDYNCNGKLDPGNVAVVSPSSGATDANGRLDVKVTYPRDHAYWVWVSLVASTTVQGTQSSTSSSFVLQGAVTDYGCSTGPPGPVSPYGVAATCANPN